MADRSKSVEVAGIRVTADTVVTDIQRLHTLGLFNYEAFRDIILPLECINNALEGVRRRYYSGAWTGDKAVYTADQAALVLDFTVRLHEEEIFPNFEAHYQILSPVPMFAYEGFGRLVAALEVAASQRLFDGNSAWLFRSLVARLGPAPATPRDFESLAASPNQLRPLFEDFHGKKEWKSASIRTPSLDEVQRIQTYPREAAILLWIWAPRWRAVLDEALGVPGLSARVREDGAYEEHAVEPERALFEAGLFPYATFAYVARRSMTSHGVLQELSEFETRVLRSPRSSRGSEEAHVEPDAGARRAEFALGIQAYVNKFVHELAGTAPEACAEAVQVITPGAVEGSALVLLALERIKEAGATSLGVGPQGAGKTPKGAVGMLLKTRPSFEEPRASVVESLKKTSAQTLLVAGCVAYPWRQFFEEALAMPGFALFIEAVYGLGKRAPAEEGEDPDNFEKISDWGVLLKVPDCNDPTCGVVDRTAVESAATALGNGGVRKVIETFERRVKLGRPDAIFLVQAALGLNRKEVEARVAKRSQLGIKALGGLPGTADVEARHGQILTFARGAAKGGKIKRESEEAAAAVALQNLAAVAGLSSPARLEWRFEIRPAAVKALGDGTFKVADTECRISVLGRRPELIISKGDKRVARPPPMITSAKWFLEFKAQQKELGEVADRYKSAFELLMCDGSMLSEAELRFLDGDFAAREILPTLVLWDGKRKLHLGPPKDAPAPAKIAHPAALAVAGLLKQAQTLVEESGIEQAFEQVERKYFVPGEGEGGRLSTRFAGETGGWMQLPARLRKRGWKWVDESDSYRRLWGGYSVFIERPAPAYPQYRMRGLYFERSDANGAIRPACSEVDPVVFSEGIRDVHWAVLEATPTALSAHMVNLKGRTAPGGRFCP
jgi:hypothetical protein